MKQNSFTFKISWHKVLIKYSPEIRLKVYDSIIEYVESGEMPEMDEPSKIAFLFIKNDIDEENKRKNEISEKRREAAMRSVEKRRKQKEAKLAIAQFAEKEHVEDVEPIFEDAGNEVNTEINVKKMDSNIQDVDFTEIILPKEIKKEEEKEIKENREKEKVHSNIYINLPKEKEIKENREKEAEKNKEKSKRKFLKENLPLKGFLDLSFVRDDFKECFSMWVEYKQSLPAKMRYNSELGIRRAYNHLFKISNGDPNTAQEIVDASIAASYQGLFPLKTQKYGERKSLTERMTAGLKRDLEEYYRRNMNQ